jgi:hypothetical protein
MAELKKHAVLLILLAILLLVKVVIVPIFDWQDIMITDIKAQQKKLAKTEGVLGKENKLATFNQQISEQLNNIDKLFYPYQTESSFKLAQQKHFESLISEYKLKVRSFSWQAASQNKEIQSIRYQVQLRVSGDINNMIDFITAIETQGTYVDVNRLDISIKSQNEKSLGTTKNARITLRFYVNEKTEQKKAA